MGAFTYFMPIVLSGLYTLMLLQYLAVPLPFPVVVLALANFRTPDLGLTTP